MKAGSALKVIGIIVTLVLFITPAAAAQGAGGCPILIEQKIVQVALSPEHQDGIDWDLFALYQKDRRSTTGFFPLSERARHRLDFKPMRKSVPEEMADNVDFEYVEQTRVNQFEFGPIWEDTRPSQKIVDDIHFGSLKIYNFKNVMDYLRTLGDAKVIFSRKWVSEDGQQSMLSTQPEVVGPAGPVVDYWEGSRLTIRPQIIENRRISFHLNSEVATSFYVDPLLYPGLPILQRGEETVARLWRLFRLNTMGLVESGETAVFEDVREGQGILIFLTPSILESHRKRLNP
jgi:hypothetical protein